MNDGYVWNAGGLPYTFQPALPVVGMSPYLAGITLQDQPEKIATLADAALQLDESPLDPRLHITDIPDKYLSVNAPYKSPKSPAPPWPFHEPDRYYVLPQKTSRALARAIAEMDQTLAGYHCSSARPKTKPLAPKHQPTLERCFDAMSQPKAFLYWINELFEEVLARQIELHGENSCMDTQGQLQIRRQLLREVIEERASAIGFRGAVSVRKALSTSEFYDIMARGYFFWDDVFLNSAHGAEAHAMQKLYLAETINNHLETTRADVARLISVISKRYQEHPILGNLLDMGISNSLRSPFSITALVGKYIV